MIAPRSEGSQTYTLCLIDDTWRIIPFLVLYHWNLQGSTVD